MKILMVLDREFPPDKRVENEINTLAQGGHEVHIACYTQKGKPEFENTENLVIHRIPISTFIYKSSVAALILPFYFNFWKKFLRKIIAGQHFDALHIHDLPLVGVGTQLKLEFNLKLVADLHENWPALLRISKHINTIQGRLLSPIFLWRQFEKKVLAKADAVIVVVEEARIRIRDLGIDNQKIYIVSNTINHTELNLVTPVINRKEIILYYAGGINHHRGLQNIILAMHKAKNSLLKLWIIGHGSYKNELSTLIERLSLTDQVIFFGFLPFQKVMEMLMQSDFALIPHLKTEHTDSTIPNKLFQYMYAGKPVLASDCLPIKRILEETGAGIVYPSGNVDHLVEILNQLHTLDYSQMSQNGIKAVTEKYNWAMDSIILKKLYKNIL